MPCVDNKLTLMAMPADLDAAFRKFIPPFGAAGNPVDITGGEPPQTYQEHDPARPRGFTDPLADPGLLAHDRHAADGVREAASSRSSTEMKAQGIVKPIVASLAGDIQVEEAAEHLYQHGIPAYAYSTEIPVAVLGAKYQWARGAGLI